MRVLANCYWTFAAADGNHIVTAQVVHKGFARPRLEFNVDVSEGEDYQQSIELTRLYSDHPIRVGNQIGIVKVAKKGWWGGVLLELRINGELVLSGQHVVLSRSTVDAIELEAAEPPTRAEERTQQAKPQGSSPTMYPTLPSKCEACGAPVRMDSVKWTGPMHAACGSCGSAVTAQWRKVLE